MGKKDTNTGETPATTSRLTPLDIQQKEFRVSRFGGYKMRDVDEFLDQLTDSFTALEAENERLRSGGQPVIGSPDLDDVNRQADEIIARARAEASRITSEARSASGATPPTPGSASGGPADRAGVNAFLTKEREFLQSLATLVGEHAEAVKGMARSARSSPAPESKAGKPQPPKPSPAEAASTAKAASTPEAASAAKASEPVADEPFPSKVQSTEPTERATPAEEPEPTRVPDSEPTVRIEEPASARAARGDDDSEGDRSLRELFWGED